MKSKNLFYYSLGIFVIVMSYYSVNVILKNKAARHFTALDNHRIEIKYQQPITFYFLRYFKCPLELKSIDEPSIDDSDDPSTLYKYYFQDFLQRNGDGYIRYYPLYNRDNNKREAYILLSAGIDGKVNNNFTYHDSLFISDFLDKINIYNPNSFYKVGDTINATKPPEFSLFDYFFGRKDYLIEYINCIDYYLSQARDTLSTQEIIEKSVAGKIRTRIWAIEGVVTGDTNLYDHTCVFFKYKDYTIENWLYNGLMDFQFHMNDTLLLTGYYVDFDDQLKIVRMRNCIPMTR